MYHLLYTKVLVLLLIPLLLSSGKNMPSSKNIYSMFRHGLVFHLWWKVLLVVTYLQQRWMKKESSNGDYKEGIVKKILQVKGSMGSRQCEWPNPVYNATPSIPSHGLINWKPRVAGTTKMNINIAFYPSVNFGVLGMVLRNSERAIMASSAPHEIMRETREILQSSWTPMRTGSTLDRWWWHLF
jgi:hypothetical protein